MSPQTLDLFKSIVTIISALLAPIIGVIGTIIVIYQYKLASLRWRLDLYDKRYPVMQSTLEYITHIASYGHMNIKDDVISKFLRGSKDYEFLFGEEVKTYLDELYKKGLKLKSLSERLDNVADNEIRNRIIDEISQHSEWFSRQYDQCNKIFSSYLKIDRK